MHLDDSSDPITCLETALSKHSGFVGTNQLARNAFTRERKRGPLMSSRGAGQTNGIGLEQARPCFDSFVPI